MEVEYQDKRRSELTQGQATAIRCALEERKRIQLESLARCEVEAKDAAFARSAHEEEAAFLAKCSRDDDFARQLHDEQYAEQMQEYEEKEALLLKEQLDLDSAADEKVRHQILFTFYFYISIMFRSSCSLPDYPCSVYHESYDYLKYCKLKVEFSEKM